MEPALDCIVLLLSSPVKPPVVIRLCPRFLRQPLGGTLSRRRCIMEWTRGLRSFQSSV